MEYDHHPKTNEAERFIHYNPVAPSNDF